LAPNPAGGAKTRRAFAPVRGPAGVQAALALAAPTRETLGAALVYNDYGAVEAPLAAACARLVVAAKSLDGRRLARRAAQALIEVADENARREQAVHGGSGLIAAARLCPGARDVAARNRPAGAADAFACERRRVARTPEAFRLGSAMASSGTT
jgi:hypothetical protein